MSTEFFNFLGIKSGCLKSLSEYMPVPPGLTSSPPSTNKSCLTSLGQLYH